MIERPRADRAVLERRPLRHRTVAAAAPRACRGPRGARRSLVPRDELEHHAPVLPRTSVLRWAPVARVLLIHVRAQAAAGDGDERLGVALLPPAQYNAREKWEGG